MSTTQLNARLMVGMEIHVELATRSKMFTSAPNIAHPDYFDAEPNSLCDPVVLGMPGVLPVMNKKAVEMSILVGLALGCKIARKTKWDRKSYYYPDLPKNYQISQYDQPLCYDGEVDVPLPDGTTKKIRIIRAHLEEDAGKLLHEAPGGFAIDYSIVDLNRAGTPLLEIVTHPDFDSAEQCVAFAQMLRDICRTLGVTEGVMQKGHIRFEPNINVVITSEKDGKTYKTPIAEIKNLNSFKAVQGAIEHEYQRQIDEWQRTGEVMKPGTKSTRGWDDATSTTFLQREKEEAHDYRYFPDPDLVPVVVDEAWLDSIRAKLPEMPGARRKRYIEKLGLGERDADMLLAEPRVAGFFDAVVTLGSDAKRAAAMILNQASKLANENNTTVADLGVKPDQIHQLLAALDKGSVGTSHVATILTVARGTTKSVDEIIVEKGLAQVSDEGALDQWVKEAIAANPKSVESFKAGKEGAINALLGFVMKASKGKANAKTVQEKLRKAMLG